MAEFLLELFSEEIPARMQPAAAQQLRERFEALLAESGLTADAVETHATPRRLALIARGLPAASAATSEERRGPRADAPAQAIEGFLKSTGLSREQLEERDTGKGVFLFANLTSDGRPTADILAEKLPALIAGFQWPKSQRWGAASASTASPRWVRPLRGILALLDREVVGFEALGLQSGRTTFGHRFMGGADPIAIDSPATYASQLHAAFVVLSAGERRALIRAGAEAAAEKVGLTLRPDEGLEAENAGLTEWPVPLLGRFDPAFLDVPPEIIQLTMRTNQKYFAVEDADGRLAPAFVCVANLVATDGGATIVAGNERVLSARLSDARFFWEQDKQKPLEAHAEKLKDIVFHEKLGTMAEKVERVAKLARWLVETHPDQFPGATPETVERAARLAKADLTTGTVGEFPELQGIIGGYLAEAQGEKPGVVSALKQHYAAVPEGCVPVAVALADRLDTMLGFFAAGMKPTGSKDPFALRRAGLGIVAMTAGAGRRLAIRPIAEAALGGTGHLSASQSGAVGEVVTFLTERLLQQLRDKGVPFDVGQASDTEADQAGRLWLLAARAQALQGLLQTDEGKNLLAGYKRAANILKAEEKKDGRAYSFDASIPLSKYIGETEKNLARLFVPAAGADAATLFDEADALLGREDFEGAMKLLATLRAPVDAFFDQTTVNDPDPDTRARRLGLLAAIRGLMHRVADFSKIEG